MLSKVLGRPGEAERAVANPRVDLGIGHHPRPPADARQNGDVLNPVIAHICDRLPDDPRRRLELPQDLAALGVDRLEPAVHRSIKRDIASRYQSAAPYWEIL